MRNDWSAKEMQEKVLKTANQKQLFKKGEKVLVALSGGADSVCLFSMLFSIKDRLGINLEAVHVNHEMRDTAKRDEEFVKALCQEKNIPCHVCSVDVKSYEKEQGIGSEEAARILRYQQFERVGEAIGADKIALAHHMDDQAETVLFHLCRGSGIKGLLGMSYQREKYVRPILNLSREDIEAYLEMNGQAYMTDETNLTDDYTRNRIRHQVLPLLNEQVANRASQHIAEAADILSLAADFLETESQKAYETCVKQTKNGLVIDILLFSKCHEYLQGEIIKKAYEGMTNSLKDFGQVHIKQVFSLLSMQSGHKVLLPRGICVMREYDTLVFQKENEAIIENMEAELLRQDQSVSENRVFLSEKEEISIRIFPYKKDDIIPSKPYTKWLDYDKIEKPLVVRNVMDDDYFYFDKNHKKLVKDYLKNEKIPISDRQSCKVVACGSHVYYFVGKRICQKAYVTDETKYILEINYKTEQST